MPTATLLLLLLKSGATDFKQMGHNVKVVSRLTVKGTKKTFQYIRRKLK